MFDAKSILGPFLGGQGADTEGRSGGSPAMSGLAGGALAGGLAALLAGTKTGRKVGKNVLAYGGTALVWPTRRGATGGPGSRPRKPRTRRPRRRPRCRRRPPTRAFCLRRVKRPVSIAV